MPDNPTHDTRTLLNPLPAFQEPPLEEVVFGVQFEPLKLFSAAHFGLYWDRIRARYPSCEDHPPLVPQRELPEIQPTTVEAVIRMGRPPARCWFISEEKTRLIQLQQDRFLMNWRRVGGAEAYPRFPTLIEAFKREWQGLLDFVEREGLGEVKVDQCELSYINHIDKGVGWEDFSDLGRVFTIIRPTGPTGFLPIPEVVSWSGAYKLPDGRGRLRVEMTPAFRGRDFKLFLSLTLTVRGAPAAQSGGRVFEWFDLAHEWVVRSFDELTQPTMHSIWKKQP